MANDNCAVEIHSSSDDERIVSITAEEKDKIMLIPGLIKKSTSNLLEKKMTKM